MELSLEFEPKAHPTTTKDTLNYSMELSLEFEPKAHPH
jgi:hypothetical protein